MDFLTTVKGSLLENFYPKGWDMAKIDVCCEKGVTREDFWHKDFNPVECENIYEFDKKYFLHFLFFLRFLSKLQRKMEKSLRSQMH